MKIIKQINNDGGISMEKKTIGKIKPEEKFPYGFTIPIEKLNGIIKLEEMETEMKKKEIQRIFLENNEERYYLKEIKESCYEFRPLLKFEKCEW